MKKTLVIVAIAIASVAALGLMAFSFADAAGGFDVPSLQAFDGPQFKEQGEGALVPYVEEAIADILGISVEELQAAHEDGVPMETLIEEAGLTPEEFRAALDEATPGIVEQALNDGAITEEQANFILEHGLHRPKGRRGLGPMAPYLLEATADALDMDPEELKAALQSGTTMNELLADAGMTHLDLRMAIDAATPDMVAQALEDGAINEDRAARLLEFGFQPPRCRNNHPGPGGPGGQGGPGGPGGPQGFGPGGFGPQAGPGFPNAPNNDG